LYSDKKRKNPLERIMSMPSLRTSKEIASSARLHQDMNAFNRLVKKHKKEEKQYMLKGLQELNKRHFQQ
jgi:hypothetical protein